VGQGQLLERSVANLWGQLVELPKQLGRQRILELLVDLGVDPSKVVDRSRLRPDASGLVEDFPGDTGDAKQLLGIDKRGLAR
jgi:hypothetical protein